MTAEWVSLTARELAQDQSLVNRGDLIEYKLWETPDGPIRYRSVIKVAQIEPGLQLGISSQETTEYLRRDGAVETTYSGYGTVWAASWDPIRVLRGGAPEIFANAVILKACCCPSFGLEALIYLFDPPV